MSIHDWFILVSTQHDARQNSLRNNIYFFKSPVFYWKKTAFNVKIVFLWAKFIYIPEQFNGMAVVLHFTLRFIFFLSLFVHRMIAKHTREGKKALACLHFFRQAMDKNTQWALFAAVYGFRVLTFCQMINSWGLSTWQYVEDQLPKVVQTNFWTRNI